MYYGRIVSKSASFFRKICETTATRRFLYSKSLGPVINQTKHLDLLLRRGFPTVLKNQKLYISCSSNKMAPVQGGVDQFIDQMNKDNKVMIWSKSYCPFCKQVKEIFNKLNQPFTVYELDLEENGASIQEGLLSKSGQKTVPNVYVNGIHVGGATNTENALKDGKLQQLLSGDTRNFDYDLFVVGGGSGGLACSKEAAGFGKKVAVADFVKPTPMNTKWGLGGTCVNVGCIPKKLMHQAALLGESLSDSRSYGWSTPEKVNHDWGMMVQAIQDHIRSLNWGYKVQLRQQNVKYYNKYASFVDQNTIKLTDANGGEETVTARNIVLATGGRPIYPDIPGAKECCITSDDIFSLSYSPGKTLFCGASYISLECAGFLHGLGYDTTVMVRSILLRGFDQEMANKVGDYMAESGIKFLKQYSLVKFEKLEEGTPGKIRVTYKNADGKIESEVYDTVVLAIGRKPLVDDVFIANAGVKVEEKSGFVLTDDNDRTNVDNIYAIGDLAYGKPELTPVAIQAGRLLAKRLFNGETRKCDYTNVATTVFTPLEYGACGLSEEDAISKYGEGNVEVYHTNFTPLEATVPHRLDNGCYAKLICNKADQNRVIGMHVLGPNAGEMIQGYALAFKTKATKEHFDELIGIHPTNAEVLTTMDKTKSSGADPSVTGC